jgi:hypothetical protein
MRPTTSESFATVTVVMAFGAAVAAGCASGSSSGSAKLRLK